MAEYLVLIYVDEQAWDTAEGATNGTLTAEHRTFGERHAARLRGGNALQPTDTATSLRRDANGTVSVTDGAFAETKEALGGYYLIEASDLDEAIEIAKDVPTRSGGVEVRPIRIFD